MPRAADAALCLFISFGVLFVVCFGAAHDIVVRTSEGFIGGAKTSRGFEFRAVPFAAPPVGELRFAPPQEVEPWEGVLNSSRIPLACPQPRTDNGPTGEDCLYASIYLPHSFEHDKRPRRDVVIFWHGGAFRGGGQINFIGDYLANNTNTVVVVAQYRLGVLGMLGHEVFMDESGTYGNYNLMDQQRVMMWVQDNIRHFGGNRKSVTITGQSAGSISVAIHSVAPASRNLYHKAIGHSGVGYSGNLLEPKSWITNTMWKVIDALGCSDETCSKESSPLSPECSDAIRQCLRAVPAETIVTIQSSLAEFAKPRPAVDGIVIPAQPIDLIRGGQFYRVPTIFGIMNNESTVLVQKSYPTYATKAHFDTYITNMFGADAIPALEQLYPVGPGALPTYYAAIAKIDTDWYYTCPTIQWLEAMGDRGHKRAYLYHWTYEADWFPNHYGAWHNEDVVYLTQQGCVLNAPTPYCNVFTPQTTPASMPLVSKLQGFWSAFAAKGKPDVRGWDAYTHVVGRKGKPHYLSIESPTSFQVKSSPIQVSQCAFLNTRV
jgi:para-nitrobenzyl esterase